MKRIGKIASANLLAAAMPLLQQLHSSLDDCFCSGQMLGETTFDKRSSMAYLSD